MKNIILNDDQIYASYQAENWWHHSTKQLFEISGAAGTGKTTCVRYIIEKLGLEINEVLFVAYTGKAATQLARNHLPAKTIHSQFYYYDKEPARDPETNKIIYLPNGKAKMIGSFKKVDRIPKKIKLIVIDEAPMVNDSFKKDIESFGVPIIALGDTNQLPPVFGNSVFLVDPDVTLHQIMRQAENDPIVWIAHRILNGQALTPGIYGKSAIIRKSDMNEFIFKNADIVITHTNRLRGAINTMFREDFNNFACPEFPYLGEKIICRKNNWDKCIDDGIYLTNGVTGTVDYVNRETYNGKTIKIDFKPDFTTKSFKNLVVDYQHLINNVDNPYSFGMNTFEFAYAITTHSAQGSQWDTVLALAENGAGDAEYRKRLLYTQVTRARKALTLAI